MTKQFSTNELVEMSSETFAQMSGGNAIIANTKEDAQELEQAHKKADELRQGVRQENQENQNKNPDESPDKVHRGVRQEKQELSQDAKERKYQQATKLALDVVDECRVQLMLKFRFLDLALWRMPCEPFAADMRYPLASDGSKLYLKPERVLARFSESFEESVRDCLHLILHCVFRHPFDEHHTNKEAWSLACDVVVEHAAMDICDKRFASALDSERRAALDELSLLCAADLNPSKLYRLFDGALKAPSGQISFAGAIGKAKLADYRSLFERDAHEFWLMYAREEKNEEQVIDEEKNFSDRADDSGSSQQADALDLDSAQEQDNSQDGNQEQKQESTKDNASSQNMAGQAQDDENAEELEQDAVSSAQKDLSGDKTNDKGSNEDLKPENNSSKNNEAALDQKLPKDQDDNQQKDNQNADNDEQSKNERNKKEWEDIAKQIEMDLQTFSKEWGKEAGSLISALKVANQKRYDYDKFLHRFAALSEEIKINDDEFDYVYYTYGLHLYGNMPLIEPLEYQETNRVRTFVIALDTSASCAGHLVKSFVQHTFNVLMGSQFFAHEIDLHIVQYDSKLQAITRIKNARDIESYMDEFKVRGGGGTDFRPVFAYVNDLRKNGELTNLKGLLYFTDGMGTFPSTPPKYESAFVFMQNDENFSPKVPPWAIKLVINEENIEEFEALDT